MQALPSQGPEGFSVSLANLGTLAYIAGMAVPPGASISLNRRIILLVLAIICFAIDAFLTFAKVSAPVNLLFLGLALFAASFL